MRRLGFSQERQKWLLRWTSRSAGQRQRLLCIHTGQYVLQHTWELDEVGVGCCTEQAGLEGGQDAQDKAPDKVDVGLLLQPIHVGNASHAVAHGSCLMRHSEV